MKPAIVQRNDTVTIVYEAPGLTLTLRGQAQDAGALGDTISVLNVESKRVVQGVVSGPGRVTVSRRQRTLVENRAAPELLPRRRPINRSASIASSKPECKVDVEIEYAFSATCVRCSARPRWRRC